MGAGEMVYIDSNGKYITLYSLGECEFPECNQKHPAYWLCGASEFLQEGCGRVVCDKHCNKYNSALMKQIGAMDTEQSPENAVHYWSCMDP